MILDEPDFYERNYSIELEFSPFSHTDLKLKIAKIESKIEKCKKYIELNDIKIDECMLTLDVHNNKNFPDKKVDDSGNE